MQKFEVEINGLWKLYFKNFWPDKLVLYINSFRVQKEVRDTVEKLLADYKDFNLRCDNLIDNLSGEDASQIKNISEELTKLIDIHKRLLHIFNLFIERSNAANDIRDFSENFRRNIQLIEQIQSRLAKQIEAIGNSEKVKGYVRDYAVFSFGHQKVTVKLVLNIDIHHDTMARGKIIGDYFQENLEYQKDSKYRNVRETCTHYLGHREEVSGQLFSFLHRVVSLAVLKNKDIIPGDCTIQFIMRRYDATPQFTDSNSRVLRIQLPLRDETLEYFIHSLMFSWPSGENLMGLDLYKVASHELTHAFSDNDLRGKLSIDDMKPLFSELGYEPRNITDKFLYMGAFCTMLKQEGIASLNKVLSNRQSNQDVSVNHLIQTYTYDPNVSPYWNEMNNDYNNLLKNPVLLKDVFQKELVYDLGSLYCFFLMISLYTRFNVFEITTNNEYILIKGKSEIIRKCIEQRSVSLKWDDRNDAEKFMQNYFRIVSRMSPGAYLKNLLERTDMSYYREYLSPRTFIDTLYLKVSENKD